MRGGFRQNAGRKKGFSTLETERARELISKKLSENLEPILEKLVLQAKNGDIKAIKELFDRAYGRPVTQFGLDNDTLTPLIISFDPSFKK